MKMVSSKQVLTVLVFPKSKEATDRVLPVILTLLKELEGTEVLTVENPSDLPHDEDPEGPRIPGRYVLMLYTCPHMPISSDLLRMLRGTRQEIIALGTLIYVKQRWHERNVEALKAHHLGYFDPDDPQSGIDTIRDILNKAN